MFTIYLISHSKDNSKQQVDLALKLQSLNCHFTKYSRIWELKKNEWLIFVFYNLSDNIVAMVVGNLISKRKNTEVVPGKKKMSSITNFLTDIILATFLEICCRITLNETTGSSYTL